MVAGCVRFRVCVPELKLNVEGSCCHGLTVFWVERMARVRAKAQRTEKE